MTNELAHQWFLLGLVFAKFAHVVHWIFESSTFEYTDGDSNWGSSHKERSLLNVSGIYMKR